MEDNIILANNALMPALTLQQAAERYNAVVAYVSSNLMKKDVDYGVIPGTPKPTLLKPGAEKLCTFFGLASRFQILTSIEDWMGEQHDGEPFFYYLYRCQLWRGDLLVAEGDGSCNSWEKKYRWRSADRLCPHCNKPTIIKGREEYGGGWLCFVKKGGCGAKFRDSDESIESQVVGLVPNPDIADQVNTVQKMAQKRALVQATLLAVNASEFFTQDVEDMMVHVPPLGSVAGEPDAAAQNWAKRFFAEALQIGYADREEITTALKELGYTTLRRDLADTMLEALRRNLNRRAA
jgi:hypothetical protein